MADDSHLRIIAFERDAHPLLGIYRPIFRRGDRVFRTDSELHDKEWLLNEAKAGRIAPLEHPVNHFPRMPVFLCFPIVDADTISFLPLQRLEKLGVAVACVELARCHETFWRCIIRVPRTNQGLTKRIYAMMFACHVLRYGVTEQLERLVTTIYTLPLKEDLTALAETWTLAKRFVLRFGKTLPDHPPLTTEQLSIPA